MVFVRVQDLKFLTTRRCCRLRHKRSAVMSTRRHNDTSMAGLAVLNASISDICDCFPFEYGSKEELDRELLAEDHNSKQNNQGAPMAIEFHACNS